MRDGRRGLGVAVRFVLGLAVDLGRGGDYVLLKPIAVWIVAKAHVIAVVKERALALEPVLVQESPVEGVEVVDHRVPVLKDLDGRMTG